MKNNSKLLNLGCGSRYHKNWINIDFISSNKNVLSYDLLKGIPYKDNTFDAVYHSHLIEHFSKISAINFIKECYRVLKPSGIIRIATPNLEEIVNNYVKYLNQALQGDNIAEFRYDFTMLEMYDQCTRTFNGGELGKLYKIGKFPDPNFVYTRTGSGNLISGGKNINQTIKMPLSYFKNKLSNTLHKIPKASLCTIAKENILKIVIGKEYKYYKLGKFMLSGEIHQWMYDRFSLKRLLVQNKFKNIKICQARESRIPKWSSYNLDTNPDGLVYKPDSIFIEAAK